jgi:hypothetical protein
MSLDYYTSSATPWVGVKYGSGAPPNAILLALAQPDPSFDYQSYHNFTYRAAGADVEAGAGTNAGLTWVTRTTMTFWIDPSHLPVKAASLSCTMYNIYNPIPLTSPAWQLWWAASPYLTPYKVPGQDGGNCWGTPLLAAASDPIPAKSWAANEPLEIDLINVKQFCVPHVYSSPNWASHCCLALVIKDEHLANPTTPYDWLVTFRSPIPNIGIPITLHYGGRTLTPLSPGPATTRTGVSGVGHQTRL